MLPPKKRPPYRACLVLGLALALGGCELLGPADDERAAFSATPVDVPPSEGADVPDSVQARYREDAARLALRYLYEHEETAADEQVELPEPLATSLYNALVRVYAARNLAARDSVVALYRIHTFPNPATRSLIVSVDSSTAEWVEAWRQGQRLTGQPRLDALMERYDLSLEEFHRWPWTDIAVLRTAEPLNLRALARLFNPIPGVTYAEPNGFAGDGNDITAEAGGEGGEAFWRLQYSVGYGDCPAGCIARRAWTFRVDADGDVRYLGVSGSPLPQR